MDTPTTAQSPSHESHGSNALVKFGIPFLLLVVGFILSGILFYQYPLKEKVVQVPVQQAKSVSLPSTAVRVSGCIPHMGEHWVDLANIPRGPYYTVNEGRVLGVEYMFKTSEIPNEVGAHMKKEDAQKFAKDNKLTFSDAVKRAIPGHIDLPLGSDIKTWDIEWSRPHAGLVEPHFDAHFYFVDQAELENICPDAPFGSDLPPEMAEELQRLGIPLP